MTAVKDLDHYLHVGFSDADQRTHYSFLEHEHPELKLTRQELDILRGSRRLHHLDTQARKPARCLQRKHMLEKVRSLLLRRAAVCWNAAILN